jgi:hypothetical protein
MRLQAIAQANPDAIGPEDVLTVDGLSSASKNQVAGGVVRVLDVLTALPPQVQVMAVAAAFWIILRGTKLRAPDVLAYVERMSRDERHSSRLDPRFAAMQWHVKDWLLGRRS